MEWLVLIGIIWFFVWVSNRNSSGSGGANADAPWGGQDLPGPFSVKVDTKTVDLEGTSIEFLQASIRGSISAPRSNYPYQLVLHIFDVTDGERKVVFCALDTMQERLTPAVEVRSGVVQLPYQSSLLADWVSALGVPVDMLSLPRSGSRVLEFRVEAVADEPRADYLIGERMAGLVLETASTRFRIQWNEAGYEELAERRQRAEELTLQLAMAVSASDGYMAPEEGKVIRDWLKKRVEGISDDDRKVREKSRLNGLVQGAFSAAKDGQLDTEFICRELRDITDTANRYDTLELCLHVAAADGRAEPGELEAVRQLGTALGISLDRLRALEEKILPISMHAGEIDENSLLGIQESMSQDEIRRHLNREYRKWNSLSSHKNPAKREQAREMLNRIAVARRRYVA